MSKYQIWKLQRPLVTNEPELQVMAYTEGRKNMAMIPMSAEDIDNLFHDDLKIYVRAKVVKGNLTVDEFVEEQPW